MSKLKMLGIGVIGLFLSGAMLMAVGCSKVGGGVIGTLNLEINKTGKVHGDLVGGRIIIEEGSSYQGKVKVIGTHSEEEKKDESINECPGPCL